MENCNKEELLKEINLVKFDKQTSLKELEREKQVFINQIKTNGLKGIGEIKNYNKPIKIKKSWFEKIKEYFNRLFLVFN